MKLVIDDKQTEYSLQTILDTVIQGDCISIMERIKQPIADMVFFDPPYFLQLPQKRLIRWKVKTEVQSPEEDWDVFASFEDYDEFISKTLMRVRSLMKPNATIWAIGTYHNIFRVGKIIQDLGFWILNDVVWYKTNAMPNWLGVRLTNATENIIWAVRSKEAKRYTFNKDMAQRYAEEDSLKYRKRKSKLGVNVWYIPVCTGEERLKCQGKEKSERLHPTQKPERLMERIIFLSTNPGDVVFDPMAGTGTTGVVAKRLGRHSIMIESNPEYVKAIMARFG
ncbi:site-specific DNA-methyltransferase [Dehalococcoidales bacterium]|nr:site-specific DNA-methyltransferase [Dehalococcoidales bacterium]